ncbi:MAG: carboxyl transferase domain-containing protein [Rhodospirillales bacterium]
MASDWDELIDELRRRRAKAQQHGGEAAVTRLHERGKLTARERVEGLVDQDSFHELGVFAEGYVANPGDAPRAVPADAVVTGWGKIDGRPVVISSDDGSIMGGAGSILNVEKRFRMRRIAVEQANPYIGLYEGSAIRFQDSMDAAIMARIPAFEPISACAGVVPQVAAVLGPCFGRPPFDVLYSDLAIMVRKTGFIGLSGPTLVRGGTGEDVDIEALAGPKMHADTTGLIDVVVNDEAACLATIREFLSYMPSSAWEAPPVRPSQDSTDRLCPELMDLVPTNLRKPYDTHRVIASIVDDGKTFEYKSSFGKSLVTCLARIGGRSVGLIASQPKQRGGVLDWAASLKGRRFVSLCNNFHIPLVFLQDQPGFLPGTESEAANILYWAATFVVAVQKATVPKIAIVLRKSHGAAMWAMGSDGEYEGGADIIAAWPTVIMTGTGPSSAVFTVHAKELERSANPEKLRQELEAKYSATGSVYRGAATFGVHEIIEPQDTRRFLAATLELACQKLARAPRPKPQLFP